MTGVAELRVVGEVGRQDGTVWTPHKSYVLSDDLYDRFILR
jgi:hypothetical protein